MSELETTSAAAPATTPTTSVLVGDRARAVFGQTMGLVALTMGVAALGAYVGRDLSRGWGIVAMIAAIGCMIGMNVAIKRSQQFAIGLLFGMGALLGIGLGPILAYYASVNPQSLWQAGGATALFIAGFGAAGYATRRDLSPLYRILFFALIGLIVFGVVAIFVTIPAASLVYSILGLVIFAGYTLVDFNRLRRAGTVDQAPLFAASIFLDVLNVFLFFLNILNR
jgi:FtsH-binding integral membrane protein